ncbi:MAG: hypothetical protein ACREQI_00775 [Candidatus Binataceae bacterium]
MQLSAGTAAHARYLLDNFAAKIRAGAPLGGGAYKEDPALKGYSTIGARVAPNSQLAWGCGDFDAGQVIDRWAAGPFHRLAMLNPHLTKAGFGTAAESGCFVMALRLPPEGELEPYAKPVEFPPAGTFAPLQWTDEENPDPLSSCSGYTAPSGLPITLQLGRLADPQISVESLSENGKPIEHCAYTARTYRNPNASAREYGRWMLRNAGAIVLVPRHPLDPGGKYAVSVTTHGHTYDWTIQIAK